MNHKIRVPKQIKITTHTYGVEFNTKECIAGGASGLCKHTFEKLCFDPALPKGQLDQTFLHEVMHMIERYCVVKLDDTDIDRIAEGLAMFLFENLDIQLDWSLIKEVN